MGKAFVNKLAKEGARDPEALAAWIGRKKHGAKAFGKLAAAGKRNRDATREARPAMQTPEERRAAGMAALAASREREVAQAREETAARRQRNAETLARINDAPGKTTRKAMTKEERSLVSYEANGAAVYAEAFERLRPFADESAQTNRIDVLKARAFQKARAERIKNGWPVPGSPVPAENEDERLAGARARLQESAARRQASRENRPEEVTRDVATAQRAAETYRSNLGRGRISHVSGEKLAELHSLVRRLSVNADADMLDRQETKALTELTSMVLREASRRRSQR
jgi:hypothetical protein